MYFWQSVWRRARRWAHLAENVSKIHTRWHVWRGERSRRACARSAHASRGRKRHPHLTRLSDVPHHPAQSRADRWVMCMFFRSRSRGWSRVCRPDISDKPNFRSFRECRERNVRVRGTYLVWSKCDCVSLNGRSEQLDFARDSAILISDDYEWRANRGPRRCRTRWDVTSRGLTNWREPVWSSPRMQIDRNASLDTLGNNMAYRGTCRRLRAWSK